jgi:tight adherence protein B
MNTTITAFDKQFPLLLRHLEVAFRSGYNVKQAFEIIAQDMPAPAGLEARWVLDEWNRNSNYVQIIEKWLARTPSRNLDLLLATFSVQLEVEGNLADMLQLLGQIMEKRRLA